MPSSTAGRFASNVWTLTASKILYSIAGLAVNVYLARHLGAGILGQFAVVMNILTLYLSLGDLGVTNYVIKEASQNRTLAATYLNNFFALQVLSGILLVGLSIGTGFAGGFDAALMIALIYGSTGIVFNGMANSFNALLQAQERMYPFAVIEMVCTVIYALGNTAMIVAGGGLYALVAVMVSVYLVKFALGLIWAGKLHLRVTWRFDRGVVASMAAHGLPFLLINGAHIAVQKLDVLLLSGLGGDEAAGVYAASSRMIYASLFIVLVFGTSLYPILSRLHGQDIEKAKALFYKSNRFLIAGSLALAIGGSALAPELIRMLYGERYAESVAVFRLLCWYLPLYAFTLLPSNLLMVSNRVWQASIASLLSLVVMAVASYGLYFVWNMQGIAAGTLLGEALVAGLSFFYATKRYGLSVGKTKAPHLLIAGGACALAELLFISFNPYLLALVLVGGFFGSLFALRIIDIDEIGEMLGYLIGRRPQQA